ncbi:hypothetical protein PMAYCL1PPCAC_08938, partial [Pristionchus mayeri]
VAVSCATTNDACACEPLPMIDAVWGIENGVPARINVLGACENPAHSLRFSVSHNVARWNLDSLSSNKSCTRSTGIFFNILIKNLSPNFDVF